MATLFGGAPLVGLETASGRRKKSYQQWDPFGNTDYGRAAAAYEKQQAIAAALGAPSDTGAHKGLLSGLANWLGRPSSAVVGGVSGLLGWDDGDGDDTNDNPFERVMQGLGGRHYGMGDFGALKVDDDDNGLQKWGKLGAAFVGDTALDPLTYLTFGVGSVGRQGAAHLVEAAMRSRADDVLARVKDTTPLQQRGRELFKGTADSVPDEIKPLFKEARDSAQAQIKDLGATGLAREGLAMGASQAVVQRGTLGLRKFLIDNLGKEVGEDVFKSLPGQLRGGVGFRLPFVGRDVNSGKLGFRAPLSNGTMAPAVLNAGGGGKLMENIPLGSKFHDRANLLRLGIQSHRLIRWGGDKINGRNGELYGGVVKDAYADERYRLYGKGSSAAADRAAKWRESLEQSAAEGGRTAGAKDALRNSIPTFERPDAPSSLTRNHWSDYSYMREATQRVGRDKAELIKRDRQELSDVERLLGFDRATEKQTRAKANELFMDRRGFERKMAELGDDAPDWEKRAFEAVARAFAFYDRKANQLTDPSLALGRKLEDYVSLIATEAAKELRKQRKTGQIKRAGGGNAGGFNPTKSRSKHWALEQVEDPETGEVRFEVVWKSPKEANAASARKRAAEQGVEPEELDDAFEEDMLKILDVYSTQINKRLSQARFAQDLRASGRLLYANPERVAYAKDGNAAADMGNRAGFESSRLQERVSPLTDPEFVRKLDAEMAARLEKLQKRQDKAAASVDRAQVEIAKRQEKLAEADANVQRFIAEHEELLARGAEEVDTSDLDAAKAELKEVQDRLTELEADFKAAEKAHADFDAAIAQAKADHKVALAEHKKAVAKAQREAKKAAKDTPPTTEWKLTTAAAPAATPAAPATTHTAGSIYELEETYRLQERELKKAQRRRGNKAERDKAEALLREAEAALLAATDGLQWRTVDVQYMHASELPSRYRHIAPDGTATPWRPTTSDFTPPEGHTFEVQVPVGLPRMPADATPDAIIAAMDDARNQLRWSNVEQHREAFQDRLNELRAMLGPDAPHLIADRARQQVFEQLERAKKHHAEQIAQIDAREAAAKKAGEPVDPERIARRTQDALLHSKQAEADDANTVYLEAFDREARAMGAKPQVGDEILVPYKGVWETVTVDAVKDGKVVVKLGKTNRSFDEDKVLLTELPATIDAPATPAAPTPAVDKSAELNAEADAMREAADAAQAQRNDDLEKQYPVDPKTGKLSDEARKAYQKAKAQHDRDLEKVQAKRNEARAAKDAQLRALDLTPVLGQKVYYQPDSTGRWVQAVVIGVQKDGKLRLNYGAKEAAGVKSNGLSLTPDGFKDVVHVRKADQVLMTDEFDPKHKLIKQNERNAAWDNLSNVKNAIVAAENAETAAGTYTPPTKQTAAAVKKQLGREVWRADDYVGNNYFMRRADGVTDKLNLTADGTYSAKGTKYEPADGPPPRVVQALIDQATAKATFRVRSIDTYTDKDGHELLRLAAEDGRYVYINREYAEALPLDGEWLAPEGHGHLVKVKDGQVQGIVAPVRPTGDMATTYKGTPTPAAPTAPKAAASDLVDYATAEAHLRAGGRAEQIMTLTDGRVHSRIVNTVLDAPYAERRGEFRLLPAEAPAGKTPEPDLPPAPELVLPDRSALPDLDAIRDEGIELEETLEQLAGQVEQLGKRKGPRKPTDEQLKAALEKVKRAEAARDRAADQLAKVRTRLDNAELRKEKADKAEVRVPKEMAKLEKARGVVEHWQQKLDDEALYAAKLAEKAETKLERAKKRLAKLVENHDDESLDELIEMNELRAVIDDLASQLPTLRAAAQAALDKADGIRILDDAGRANKFRDKMLDDELEMASLLAKFEELQAGGTEMEEAAGNVVQQLANILQANPDLGKQYIRRVASKRKIVEVHSWNDQGTQWAISKGMTAFGDAHGQEAISITGDAAEILANSYGTQEFMKIVESFYKGHGQIDNEQWNAIMRPFMTLFKTNATMGPFGLKATGFMTRNLIGALWNQSIHGLDGTDIKVSFQLMQAEQRARKAALKELQEKAAAANRPVSLVELDKLTASKLRGYDVELPDGTTKRVKGILEGKKVAGHSLLDIFKAAELQDITGTSKHEFLGTPGAQSIDDVHASLNSAGYGKNLKSRNLQPVFQGEDLGILKTLGNKSIDNFGTRTAIGANDLLETFVRRMGFVRGVREFGLADGGKAAAALVRLLHFDYTDLSDFEARWARFLFPFYKWSRHNIPLQFKTLLSRPGRAAELIRFSETMQAGLGSDDERVENLPLPEFVLEKLGFATGMKYGDNFLAMGVESPMNDLNAMFNWNPTNPIALNQSISMLNPLIKSGYAMASGTDPNTGATFDGRGKTPGMTYSLLSNLPGIPNTYRNADGETVAPARAAFVLKNTIPGVSTIDNVVGPLIGAGGPEAEKRQLTNLLSALFGMPIYTLTPEQMYGETLSRTQRIQRNNDRRIGEGEIDNERLRAQFRRMQNPAALQAAIEAGAYDRIPVE